MAELRPIKPLLYNPEVVGDLSSVITPPYDVISAISQEMYRERSPYSAIHLELPVAYDGEDGYTAAAALLARWKDEGVLVSREDPAMFIHRQEYELGGTRRARTALLAGVRLEPWEARVVLPHERTFRGPKQDRLALLRATAVAPSSIFSLYERPEVVGEVMGTVMQAEPLRTAIDEGVTHSLWAIDRPEQVQAVAEAMADRQLYIADGHHRYETALAYRDERREATGNAGDAAFNYVAMSLVAFDDPGLVVLPTHRLVFDVAAEAVRRLRESLERAFEVRTVEEYERTEEDVSRLLDSAAPYLFLLYDGRNLMRVSGGEAVADRLPQDRSAAWRRLDVAALHDLVLRDALGTPSESIEEHVRYTRDVPGAFEQVDAGGAQLAAFVRPTPVDQLRAVADAGDKMPQKSTYFYPKFPAGLVINRLDVALPAAAGVVR